ncbi:hypothetical protein PF005_g30565 [Phytophthora fragariae]|uniref:Uncharacterized protein n=1 Tax=Phytophthora fragariae TaxID=53985 RepID=A0A6A3H7B7_9STRA|nr:hypothetical protein PF003_g36512 [Phytophthora fragariae]KAE8919048.1 hypothetical protein PF009_g30639 [Phytophthora fragariae]KAE8964698.1 hypothetical protein PF011_g28569 [Phytophthora fragariae]KAE9061913.1 hypothetical protein PF007_g30091 [Phytophthora fragariae]KAE9066152.1 hypothetical protein PF006_g30307 [Phytophthora fragariae]
MHAMLLILTLESSTTDIADKFRVKVDQLCQGHASKVHLLIATVSVFQLVPGNQDAVSFFISGIPLV